MRLPVFIYKNRLWHPLGCSAV